ncbi:WD40-repeat-containing domain protein [Coprinopsis sp. MPI-PUGE-AT-0042]|nr:WD40-repeat-containing domain protein [Coprinopsis sp. MPI-PUGE-AT-0042]
MDSSSSANYLVAEAQLLAEKARSEKARRLKDVGNPIQLPGKALDIKIQGNYAWIAENTATVKKLDLESGKTVQLYKGHTGPVTSIAFYSRDKQRILVSGSWDRSIRLWNTSKKELLSTTVDAHSDFVKTLLVVPDAQLLVSGGSDKIVRFWDLGDPTKPLQNTGSISSHTRPVECLAGYSISPTSVLLYTADTMGIIRIWHLQQAERQEGVAPLWKVSQKGELNEHRTRINDLAIGQGLVWTASTDETIQIHPAVDVEEKGVAPALKGPKSIQHPAAVRAILPLALTDLGEPYLLTVAGDTLHVYDISTLDEPELLSSTDVHWHDVTAVKLWYRKTDKEGVIHAEPWIVTTSLDQTIRKWRLTDLITPPPAEEVKDEEKKEVADSGMTEEEERELAELLDED